MSSISPSNRARMTPPYHDFQTIGVYVSGPPTSRRELVRHADLLTAWTDGAILERDETREAYLSHFVFSPEVRAHFFANRQSVAGYAGLCWCRWLILDIDRGELADALADAHKLVKELHHRYPETIGGVPVWFSGDKGFHVAVELAHLPPPAVGFHQVARTFAEALAERARVTIDTSIYELNHLMRLPNTQHPRTELYKRLFLSKSLLQLSVEKILEKAKHPLRGGLRAVRTVPQQLVADWHAAEQETAREARKAARM
jgi:hypothetical protein